MQSIYRNNGEAFEPTDLADAMVRANLDWGIHSEGLITDGGIIVPKMKAVIRDDTSKVIGVVNDTYELVPNSMAFAPFGDVFARTGVKLVGGGSLRGGSLVWLQVDLGMAFDAVPGDTVQGYGTILSSHDGSRSIGMGYTMVRVVCQNTFIRAHGQMEWKVRHTESAPETIQSAADALGWSRKAFIETQEAVDQLTRIMLTAQKVDEFVNELFPLPENVVRPARTINLRQSVRDLIDGGRGNDLPGVRGTAWAALNAVTELVDHHQDRTFESKAWGPGRDLKARAFEAALALA